jgi:hypothetical protein
MNQELLERIDLIERMVMEGRRSTQYWGWNFVLWGTGQLLAIAWSAYGGAPALAWGVTMAICGILTGIFIAVQRGRETRESITGRAIWSMWFSFGITIALLAFLGNPRALFTPRGFMVVFLALMGLTNVASGLVLRWRTQLGVGLLWNDLCRRDSVWALFDGQREGGPSPCQTCLNSTKWCTASFVSRCCRS